jgi:hypothetical protein
LQLAAAERAQRPLGEVLELEAAQRLPRRLPVVGGGGGEGKEEGGGGVGGGASKSLFPPPEPES